jgi:hypothetical protein
MKHAICYISTATRELSNPEIEDLFREWKENNTQQQIQGILLYSEGHFFQVLEGERTTVLELYNKINKDRRHSGIIQVLGKDIQKGSLDGYITENITAGNFSRPELIRDYLESVKGMDRRTQQQIKSILDSFLDTQVL